MKNKQNKKADEKKSISAKPAVIEAAKGGDSTVAVVDAAEKKSADSLKASSKSKNKEPLSTKKTDVENTPSETKYVAESDDEATAKEGNADEKAETKKSDYLWEVDEHSPAKFADMVHFLSIHTLFSIVRKRLAIFISVILCFSIALAGYYLLVDGKTASAVMSLNFEESSKGRNPNGTRFNVSEMRSVDIAQEAIDSAGLTGLVSAKQIADAISITPYTNRGVSADANYYINSSYNIGFNKPDGDALRQISADDMLSLICNKYKAKFYKEHIIVYNLTDGEPNFNDMDYSDISAYFIMLSNKADRYLDMRINESGSFSTDNGENFKTLRKLISNLKSYDLANFDSYIWENGISKNKIRRIETLRYENHTLDWVYTQSMEENEAIVQTLKDYNQAMIASILIPTYDELDEFYMSRTKTGVDDLAKAADAKLTAAKQAELSIAINDDKIEKLSRYTGVDKYKYANFMVEMIQQKINEISEKINDMDSAYTLQKTRNYITFSRSHPSLLSRIHYKRIILADFILFVFLYYILVSVEKRRRRKSL